MIATLPPLLRDDQYDRRLAELVRPSDWKNPDPASRYNLVVLGAGTAGLVCAMGAARLGACVALVEHHLLGGDCLVTGCVPSKGLIRAAATAHQVKSASRFGIHCSTTRIDFAQVMAWMRSRRARLAQHDSVQRFSAAGVDVFLGEGRFVSRSSLEVAGKTLRFHRAVIATGGRAAIPPVEGLDEAGYLTSETVFSLTERPQRLLVIGAGPIGCELAQTFQRLGSEVTLISDQELLPKDDPRAAELLERRFVEEGLRVITGAQIVRARKLAKASLGNGTSAELDCAVKQIEYEEAGRREIIETDEILLAVGRRPNVEGLGLDAAGVTHDPHRGVNVNDQLRSTNPRIYAAGDVCSRLQFTHAADAQARIVLRNALFFGRARQSALVIPWCTYTDPEVAHVGLPTRQAAADSTLCPVTVNLEEVDRAVVDGETTGYGCVYHDRKGRIRSATIVANDAGNMIGELSLAMTHHLTLAQLGSTVHPYPTEAELLKRLGDAYNRTRLTPRIRHLFQRYFQWFRWPH